MRRRVRSGVIAVAVVGSIALVAVWIGGSPAVSPHIAPQVTQRAQTGDSVGVTEAKRLLASAILPAGARLVNASSVSGIPAQLGPSCTPKVIRTRYVVVPFSTPSAVRQFVIGHLITGLTVGTVGSESTNGADPALIVSQDDTAFHQLYFTIVRAADGGSVVRIDAIVLDRNGVCEYAAVMAGASLHPLRSDAA